MIIVERLIVGRRLAAEFGKVSLRAVGIDSRPDVNRRRVEELLHLLVGGVAFRQTLNPGNGARGSSEIVPFDSCNDQHRRALGAFIVRSRSQLDPPDFVLARGVIHFGDAQEFLVLTPQLLEVCDHRLVVQMVGR